jgi:excisionase family DNA binding protein
MMPSMTTEQATASDASLLRAVLDGDEDAWRALVVRYHDALREVVREASSTIRPLTDAEIEAVLTDAWRRLVEDDKRRLRAFKPERGAALLAWLTIHVAEIAHEHMRRNGQPATEAPPRRFHPGTMMRVEEVAARWDLNPKTVYGMIERGELRARRCGRVLRVPRWAVESFEQASVAPERK